MKQNKYIYGIIEVVVLIVVILLAFTTLNSQYLFGWAAHNWIFYLVLSSIPLLLLFFNKPIVSALITIGITFGIFAGNYLGAMLRNYNISKIVEGMEAQEVARLHLDHGFVIWIGIITLFFILGLLYKLVPKRKYQIYKLMNIISKRKYNHSMFVT